MEFLAVAVFRTRISVVASEVKELTLGSCKELRDVVKHTMVV